MNNKRFCLGCSQYREKRDFTLKRGSSNTCDNCKKKAGSLNIRRRVAESLRKESSLQYLNDKKISKKMGHKSIKIENILLDRELEKELESLL